MCNKDKIIISYNSLVLNISEKKLSELYQLSESYQRSQNKRRKISLYDFKNSRSSKTILSKYFTYFLHRLQIRMILENCRFQ